MSCRWPHQHVSQYWWITSILIQYHYFSIHVYSAVIISQVHKGVKGFVFDVKTNAGLQGTIIQVEGIAKNITSSEFGDYWRLLVPGKYSITAHRDGYNV